MIKFGLTGSISSGKTTASKIISKKRGPLFSADKVVRKLYTKTQFRKIIAKKLKFKLSSKFKKDIRLSVIKERKNLVKLEKLIHPIVRKEMIIFLNKNRDKEFLFFEIPLLIENKLQNYFDKIIFVKSSKKLRLKRYKLDGGDGKLFKFLDSKQIKAEKKMKLCDHVVVNNKSLFILKKNLLNIIKEYE